MVFAFILQNSVLSQETDAAVDTSVALEAMADGAGTGTSDPMVSGSFSVEIYFDVFNRIGVTRNELYSGARDKEDDVFTYLNVLEGAVTFSWWEVKGYSASGGLTYLSNAVSSIDNIECLDALPTGSTCHKLTSTLNLQTDNPRKKKSVDLMVNTTYAEAIADGTMQEQLLHVDLLTPFTIIDAYTVGEKKQSKGETSDSAWAHSSSTEDGSQNLGAIIGGIVGGVAALLCCCCCLVGAFFYRNKMRNDEKEDRDPLENGRSGNTAETMRSMHSNSSAERSHAGSHGRSRHQRPPPSIHRGMPPPRGPPPRGPPPRGPPPPPAPNSHRGYIHNRDLGYSRSVAPPGYDNNREPDYSRSVGPPGYDNNNERGLYPMGEGAMSSRNYNQPGYPPPTPTPTPTPWHERPDHSREQRV